MNIALFTEGYYCGGVDTFVITLINHWPEPADNFTLFCNEDHPGLIDIREQLQRQCSIVTHHIRTYTRLATATSGSKSLDLLRKASSPILRYLFLVHAVRKLRPLLCNGHFDRLMVVNGGYPGGDTCRAAGIAWGICSGRPSSIHNFHNLATPPVTYSQFQENAVDKLLSRHTKAFVTVSQSAASSMSLRPAIPAEKVFYIYNGLDFSNRQESNTNIRLELELSIETPLCLTLATYQPRKGHSFLLRMFRLVVDQIPDAHFVICGQGSKREIAEVRYMVVELGLTGNVHLMGFRNDVIQLLLQANLLLVGSQEFESFGLTCVEAMAHRIPVVATRVGGLPEVVVDGDGGYTFDKDDIEGYARQVTTLLLDEQLRIEQGSKGHDRYLKFFTAQRMAEEYAEFIR